MDVALTMKSCNNVVNIRVLQPLFFPIVSKMVWVKDSLRRWETEYSMATPNQLPERRLKASSFGACPLEWGPCRIASRT